MRARTIAGAVEEARAPMPADVVEDADLALGIAQRNDAVDAAELQGDEVSGLLERS